jgi:hypothetical protein
MCMQESTGVHDSYKMSTRSTHFMAVVHKGLLEVQTGVCTCTTFLLTVLGS